MAELKPCPFCGGEADFIVTCATPDETPRGFFRCENMCCEQSYVRNKDEAEEEWNRRAEPQNVNIDFDYAADM